MCVCVCVCDCVCVYISQYESSFSLLFMCSVFLSFETKETKRRRRNDNNYVATRHLKKLFRQRKKKFTQNHIYKTESK